MGLYQINKKFHDILAVSIKYTSVTDRRRDRRTLDNG